MVGVCKRSFTKINYAFRCICNESNAPPRRVDDPFVFIRWQIEAFTSSKSSSKSRDIIQRFEQNLNHLTCPDLRPILHVHIGSRFKFEWKFRGCDAFRSNLGGRRSSRGVVSDHRGSIRGSKAVVPLLSPTCHDLSLPIFLHPASFVVHQATPPRNG